jgi:hypothetical protein
MLLVKLNKESANFALIELAFTAPPRELLIDALIQRAKSLAPHYTHIT